MNIEIESRESIEARAKKPFPAHTALISIADPDCDFVLLENRPEYLLQLKFDDVSNDDYNEILEDYPSTAEATKAAQKYNWFNDEQASEIAVFVKPVKDKAEILICQCEYGQSRSAGLAAAVKQFLDKSGIDIFADDRYYPNKLVYRKVLAALEKTERGV